MTYRVTLTLRDTEQVERYMQYDVMSKWEVRRLEKMVGTKWNEDEVVGMEWEPNTHTENK